MRCAPMKARAATAPRARNSVARKQGRIYGLSGPEALMRNLAHARCWAASACCARYDWLYGWQPAARLLRSTVSA